MNKLLAAIALSIGLPSVAYAQAAPAPAEKPGCCEKMKAEGKKCCCDKSEGAAAGHGSHGAGDHQH